MREQGIEKRRVFAVHISSRATLVKEQSRRNDRDKCSGNVLIAKHHRTNKHTNEK